MQAEKTSATTVAVVAGPVASPVDEQPALNSSIQVLYSQVKSSNPTHKPPPSPKKQVQVPNISCQEELISAALRSTSPIPTYSPRKAQPHRIGKLEANAIKAANAAAQQPWSSPRATALHLSYQAAAAASATAVSAPAAQPSGTPRVVSSSSKAPFPTDHLPPVGSDAYYLMVVMRHKKKREAARQAAQADAAADATKDMTSDDGADTPAPPMADLHPLATLANSSSSVISSSISSKSNTASKWELTPEMEQELLQSSTACPPHSPRKGYSSGMGRLKAKAATAAAAKFANIAAAAQKPWSSPAGTAGHLRIAISSSPASDPSEPATSTAPWVLPSPGVRSAAAAASPLAAKGTADWCKQALAEQRRKQGLLIASQAALAAALVPDEAPMLANSPCSPHHATSRRGQDEARAQHMVMVASASSGVASHPIMGVDDEGSVERPKKGAALLWRVVKAVVCSWW